MKNKKNRNKCIFCLSEKGSFFKDEHVIPESLGGDVIIPRGFVCDNCNSYFGTKIEKEALTISPLAFARALMCVKSKKKRATHFKGFRFEIHGTGDTPSVEFHPDKAKAAKKYGTGTLIFPNERMSSLTRLLLKMGLELIAIDNKINVYDPIFDKARNAARTPKKSSMWKIAETPLPTEYVWESGEDNKGAYAKRTIYAYGLYNHQGMIVFHFQYWRYCFIIPLTDGNLEDAIDILNKENSAVPPFRISYIKLVQD